MTGHRTAGAVLLRLLFPMLVLQPAVIAAVSESFVSDHFERLDTLFSQLDPEHPVTGVLRDRWMAGERQAAANALSGYFAKKSLPLDFLGPVYLPENLAEHADAALKNRFLILGEWETIPEQDDGHLDWNYRGTRGDKEIAWMLNRHGFLPVLAEKDLSSTDEKYRKQLNRLWSDWILANPYPGGLTFSPPWRALEVARRVLNAWVYLFYEYNRLDPETRLLVLSSIPDHADSLHRHASFWGGNHLISEKLALLTIAHAWPEFGDAAEWKADATAELTRQFREQTYPDGSYRELSNHYQRVVLVNARFFMRLLAEMDPDYRTRPVAQRIESMWDFFARSMRPDGFGPLNNASDLEYNAGFILDEWEAYDRPDWRYMATNGKQGQPPQDSPSVLFPWAGQVYIRSGWEASADWIYFDAGPFGTAHQHTDRMHVSVVLDGKPLLTDTGRFTYKPGPWKDYFQGPDGHNVLQLDGHAARQAPRNIRQPLPVYFEERAEVAMTAAQGRFPAGLETGLLPPMQSPVPWTRAILYDKRGFIIIIDHLVAFTRHELKATWNLHPDAGKVFLQMHASGEARLSHAYSPAQGKPEPEGFYSPDYNLKYPTPRYTVTTTIDRPTTLYMVVDSATRRKGPLHLEVHSQPGAKTFRFSVSDPSGIQATATVDLFPVPRLIDYSLPQ